MVWATLPSAKSYCRFYAILLELLSARRVRVFVLKKVSVRLVYYLCILRDAIIAVAVVSLIRIIREGKHDADLFIRKRYIQLVKFIAELAPQKVNKKK